MQRKPSTNPLQTPLNFVDFYDKELQPATYYLTNFGGQAPLKSSLYENRFGDKGKFSEVTFQAAKFHFLEKLVLVNKLKGITRETINSWKQSYYQELSTKNPDGQPKQAYAFMKKPRVKSASDPSTFLSIDDLVTQGGWHTKNTSGITPKEQEMSYCLLSKFSSPPYDGLPINDNNNYKAKLRAQVKDNSTILVETSHEDSFWGYAYYDPDAPKNKSSLKKNINSKPGKNRLGLMLTALGRLLNKPDFWFQPITVQQPQLIAEYLKLVKSFPDNFDFITKSSFIPLSKTPAPKRPLPKPPGQTIKSTIEPTELPIATQPKPAVDIGESFNKDIQNINNQLSLNGWSHQPYTQTNAPNDRCVRFYKIDRTNKRLEFDVYTNKITTNQDEKETFAAMLKAFEIKYPNRLPAITTDKAGKQVWKEVLAGSQHYTDAQIKEIIKITQAPEQAANTGQQPTTQQQPPANQPAIDPPPLPTNQQQPLNRKGTRNAPLVTPQQPDGRTYTIDSDSDSEDGYKADPDSSEDEISNRTSRHTRS